MKKAVCVIGFMVVCGALAAQAGDLVSAPTPPAQPVHRIQGVGYWTLDYVTGVITPGQHEGRATTVYDDTANSTGIALGGVFPGDEVGDDVFTTGGGLLQELDLSIFNNDVSDLTAIDVTVKFYNHTDLTTPVGSFTTTLTYTTPLPPGYVSFWGITGLGGENINLPAGQLLVTQTYANPQGGAAIFGEGAFDPTVTGMSQDIFYINGLWYIFTGWSPAGSFYYRIAVDPAPGNKILWTTGLPRAVVFNGSPTHLGYNSGKVAGAGDQRWAAIPFRVASATTIKQIDLYWFIPAPPPDPTADNVKYIIWHRNGLNKPTSNADKFSEGVLGVYGPGTLDGNYSAYPVNIPIPAGDYYLTEYADGGDPSHDWNAPWLTGGDKQDPALEQAFMWRSASFPTPGFVAYAPAAVQPGPTMPDPNDRWNPAFVLWEQGVSHCQGDFNCDGFIDFNDIDPFVAVLSGGPCCDPTNYNCDVNGNGSVGFDDIDPFVALLSSGATCP